MSNTQTVQDAPQPVGIIQSSYTVSITFTTKPGIEQRAKLKASGFIFDRGRWYRNQSDSSMGSAETVDQLLAA